MVVEPTTRKRLGDTLTSKMRADMNAAGIPQSDIDSRAARSRRRIDEAPVVILLCRDVTAVRGNEPEEEIMAIQSVAAAGLQFMLAAHAEGLGSNWICWPLYAQSEARDVLELEKSWEPQAMFFLGYADETPRYKFLKPLEKIMVTR
jgi:nitroreductase